MSKLATTIRRRLPWTATAAAKAAPLQVATGAWESEGGAAAAPRVRSAGTLGEPGSGALAALRERRIGAASDARRVGWLAEQARYPQDRARLERLRAQGDADVASLDSLNESLGGKGFPGDTPSFKGTEQEAWSTAVNKATSASVAYLDLRGTLGWDPLTVALLEKGAAHERQRRSALIELVGRSDLPPTASTPEKVLVPVRAKKATS
jgi:hypothetical protein